MCIMANKMDELIESGLRQMEEYLDKTAEMINAYSNECGYTWTAIRIFEEYSKSYRNKKYVSHTCLDVILKFKDRLIKLYGDRLSS